MSTLMSQARSRVPRIAEAAVERARLTVVPRAAARAARVPFVALVSLLLVAGVAGLLFFNTSMQQVSFTATALEQKALALDAERQGLQMELDELRDPQRIAVQAKTMGMVPPASPAFIRLGDGRVLGTPLPALSADAMRVTSRPTARPKSLTPIPKVIRPATTSDRTKKPTTGAASTAVQEPTGTKRSQDR